MINDMTIFDDHAFGYSIENPCKFGFEGLTKTSKK
jgi:hypothetical protein